MLNAKIPQIIVTSIQIVLLLRLLLLVNNLILMVVFPKFALKMSILVEPLDLKFELSLLLKKGHFWVIKKTLKNPLNANMVSKYYMFIALLYSYQILQKSN